MVNTKYFFDKKIRKLEYKMFKIAIFTILVRLINFHRYTITAIQRSPRKVVIRSYIFPPEINDETEKLSEIFQLQSSLGRECQTFRVYFQKSISLSKAS